MRSEKYQVCNGLNQRRGLEWPVRDSIPSVIHRLCVPMHAKSVVMNQTSSLDSIPSVIHRLCVPMHAKSVVMNQTSSLDSIPSV
ncbi:hypothetical protein AVEN_223623-1, partial [Araneus ventricosus]